SFLTALSQEPIEMRSGSWPEVIMRVTCSLASPEGTSILTLTPVFSVIYFEVRLSPQVLAYQLAPTNQVRLTGLVSSFHAGSSGLSAVSLATGDCVVFEGFEVVVFSLLLPELLQAAMTSIGMTA